MEKYEKEVMQAKLDSEKAVLKQLEASYKQALEEINQKIAELLARQDSDLQHVIYQVEYQRALKTQVQAILETLQANEFETISEYLTKSYDEGFLGAMYALQAQGIPLIIPIDQAQVVEAIQHETMLSEKLYTRLGRDIKDLNKHISSEISRGIASGMMYSEIARNIANRARIPQNNAMRIVRTEAGRISEKAAMDACVKARQRGAKVKKQWNAILDSRTRHSHVKVDGEIRDIDEKFSNGLMYPLQPGAPAREVVNCRCRLNQRASWALDAEHTKRLGDISDMSEENLQVIADKLGLSVDEVKALSGQIVPIKAKNFEDFKKTYTGLSAQISGEGIPEHEEPKLLNTIKYSDKKAVMKEITKFETGAVKESIETACVVTVDGEVYQCFGIENRVFPDFDLKGKLFGATISHNHPIDETMYTFSSDDLSLFMEYKLEVLRGCDEKYIYEFNRDASDIDDEPDDWMNFENFEHGRIIEKAKALGIGYRRWLNE